MSPLDDPSGELERLRAALAQAEAARRVAEEALLHSTDKLRSMVSALPVGVMTIDRQGRVELWNRAAEAMLGYAAEEMVGGPMPTALFLSPTPDGPTDGRTAADVFLRMVTGQLIKGEEVQCRRKDGSRVAASFSGVGLMDADERLRCAICVFEDIEQRKEVARQLHQAQKMEAVGQLTGGLAHDFNNILGIAIGNLDLLEEELTDRPDSVEMVDIARKALLRGAELTRALLAFSRRQPLLPVRVDAAALLSSVTRMLSRVLGEQICVEFRAAKDLWPVTVDPVQLETAITNLAINARDAMPRGGRLTVAARNAALDDDYAQHNPDAEPGDYLLIEISDTGQGMPPEVVSRVFEPFFTTKPAGKGTGLGLSMVYGFIKQSGGHIKIYSEVGIGTTVRLYLARSRADRDLLDSDHPSEEPPPGGSETILVVEDNEDVRRMVRHRLTRLGYRVVVAENAVAALETMDGMEQLDLLFTDVVMPGGMNGFQLAEAAIARRPGLKVLFTSGFPGTTLDLPPDPQQPARFLSKPYRGQELARVVRDLLDAKGNRR